MMTLGEFLKFSDMAGLSAPATGGPGATLRNIATRCRHALQFNAGFQFMYSRTLHVNRGDNVSQIQPVWGNWFADYTGETSPAQSITLTAAVEYPLGSAPVQVTWAGSASVSIASGAEAVPDPCVIVIPKGAMFAIRNLQAAPGGIVFSAGAVTFGNEVGLVSTTPLADTTMVLSQPAGNQQLAFYPLAILGVSSVQSVSVYGDSRNSGLQDDANSNIGLGGIGEICRALDSYLPYTNLGCQSDTAAQFVLTHTLRARAQQYHTHVHIQYGINDLVAGRTAAQTLTSLKAVYALFPTKRVSQSTIAPVSTSTNAWADEAGQTTVSTNSARVTLNTSIRAVPAPLYVVFDTAAAVESQTKTGCFKGSDSLPLGSVTRAVSSDGTHESAYGYGLIQRSGAINPAVFT